MEHSDYPHEPGRLYGCAACEAECFCMPGEEDCAYNGMHTPWENAAAKLGSEHGKAAASWVFDGDTTRETYLATAKMLDDGDPEFWDVYRSPLSGEFADDMTPEKLFDEIGLPDDHRREALWSSICDAYEFAHSQAWSDEIERVARYQLDG